jgi:hypothetical protein
VLHRRSVQWLNGSGWIIIDDIEGSGDHDVRLHWLTADLAYEAVDKPFHVLFNSCHSPIRWNIFSSVPGSGTIIRAGRRTGKHSAAASSDPEIGLLGWESPTYGDLRPAVSLLYETRSQIPVRFVTVVLTDESCRVESSDNELLIFKTEFQNNVENQSEIYRVNLSTNAVRSAAAERTLVSVPKA